MARRQNPVADRAAGLFQKTDVQESEHLNGQTVEQLPPERPERVKRTYYLPREVALLLDEIQVREYRRTGEKPELSDLVTEAIRLLASSHHQES